MEPSQGNIGIDGSIRNNVNSDICSLVKLLYNNVDNSLLSKYDELRLRMYNDKLDVVALTEIKPKNGEIPDTGILEIEGYDMYLSELNAPFTRGVCIYVHKRLRSISVSIAVNIQYKA